MRNDMFNLLAHYIERSRYWDNEPDETRAGGVFATAHAAECLSVNPHRPSVEGLQIVAGAQC